jgi:hypothetical protein
VTHCDDERRPGLIAASRERNDLLELAPGGDVVDARDPIHPTDVKPAPVGAERQTESHRLSQREPPWEPTDHTPDG